jgi:tetratricopeptide (TPR) repeat protein
MARHDKARSGKRAERPRAPAPPPAVDAALEGRLATWMVVALALLLGARALLTPVHTMWAWSLNLQRFLEPGVGWGLWLLAAAALVPPLARRAAPAWTAAGDLITRRPVLAVAGCALAGALLAWLAPDRVRFVGDFLLRQGTVSEAQRPSEIYPQALPLDVFLHYTLPRFVADSRMLDANGAARALGMIEIAVLAGLAATFARALAFPAAATVAVASVVFFGGYLGMFTGFSKAFAEMCLLVAAVGTYGLRAIREGRGLLVLGLLLAVGITLHRSALGLFPAGALAWGLWLATHGRAGAWRRPVPLLAAAIPVVSFAVMAPRILAIVRRWDAEHFTPHSVQQTGVLAAAFAGARPADLLNLIVMLSPLALLLPGLLPGAWRHLPAKGRREAAFLALLALPFVAVMPFLHPAQGLFRDWDDFAAGGVAISLLVAWSVGHGLRAMRRHAWLAVAITACAAAPTLQWLAHHVDQERGFARVRAFLREPPPREPAERGTTFDYLGIWAFNLERWDEAAEAFGRAAQTAPSPRILQEWALAETMRRNFPGARAAYYKMLEKAPDSVLGWLGLATVSINMGDAAEARRAALKLLALEPRSPDAMRVLDAANRLEAMRADSTRLRPGGTR